MNLSRLTRTIKSLSIPLRPRFSFAYQANSNEVDSHTMELQDEHYLTFRKEEFKKYYTINPNTLIQGFATSDGTLTYSQSRKDYDDEKHFRKPYHDELTLSSIGLGTYVGAPDENDDIKVFLQLILKNIRK